MLGSRLAIQRQACMLMVKVQWCLAVGALAMAVCRGGLVRTGSGRTVFGKRVCGGGAGAYDMQSQGRDR